VSVNGDKFSGKLLAKDVLGNKPVLRLGKKSVRVQWVD